MENVIFATEVYAIITVLVSCSIIYGTEVNEHSG